MKKPIFGLLFTLNIIHIGDSQAQSAWPSLTGDLAAHKKAVKYIKIFSVLKRRLFYKSTNNY